MLAEHRPVELVAARLEVFRRWPSSSTAAHLHQDAGEAWPQHHDEVVQRLAVSPRDVVLFALLSLKDVQRAWELAHPMGLDDDGTWSGLIVGSMARRYPPTCCSVVRAWPAWLRRVGSLPRLGSSSSRSS
ncbi:MAG: hypothetical protein M3070_05110 [Actinomycetota bacterium]|nr:hypothetical protein [Actinomycetota bacterium]